MAVLSALVSLVLTPLFIITDEYLLNFEDWFKGIPQFISQGLFPFILFFGGFGLYAYFLKWRFKANKPELIISVFVVFEMGLTSVGG